MYYLEHSSLNFFFGAATVLLLQGGAAFPIVCMFVFLLIVLTLHMLRPLVDCFWTSCRHLVCVSSPDQSVFVSVETFRAHSAFMTSQENNLSDPYIEAIEFHHTLILRVQ